LNLSFNIKNQFKYLNVLFWTFLFIFVLIWASGLKTDSTMQCRMNRSAKIQPAKTGDFFDNLLAEDLDNASGELIDK